MLKKEIRKRPINQFGLATPIMIVLDLKIRFFDNTDLILKMMMMP